MHILACMQLRMQLTFVLHQDPTFDTLNNPLYGTAGRYKPNAPRHRDVTLGGLANGSVDAADGGSHESISRIDRDELLHNVKNRYDVEDDVIL